MCEWSMGNSLPSCRLAFGCFVILFASYYEAIGFVFVLGAIQNILLCYIMLISLFFTSHNLTLIYFFSNEPKDQRLGRSKDFLMVA
jgi:hypothetical protein